MRRSSRRVDTRRVARRPNQARSSTRTFRDPRHEREAKRSSTLRRILVRRRPVWFDGCAEGYLPRPFPIGSSYEDRLGGRGGKLPVRICSHCVRGKPGASRNSVRIHLERAVRCKSRLDLTQSLSSSGNADGALHQTLRGFDVSINESVGQRSFTRTLRRGIRPAASLRRLHRLEKK